MSTLPLPSDMYARYGTYEFNSTTETLALSVKPHKGADGRATAYSEWMLRLKFDVSSDANNRVDDEMTTLISQLNHTGEEFVYRGRGYGNPDVNLTGVTDIKWGPHGEIESMKLNAAGRAIEVVWSVRFCIPTCPEKWFGNANPFLELAFTVTHTPDLSGYVTRSYRGYVSIGNNRTAPGSVRALRSPDDYRESILTPMVEGFHRKYEPWTVSEDRTRLDFSWQDVEMKAILPADVVDCHISDQVNSTKAGLVAWQGSIAGSYVLRRGASPLIAALHFLKTVKEICSARNLGLTLQAAQTRTAGASTIIPMSFSATNPDYFGPPSAHFNFGYTFSCGLEKLFQIVNLWKPLNTGTWQEWTASLKDSALHPYGGAKVRFTTNNDVILDPCYTLGKGTPAVKELRSAVKGTSQTLTDLFPKPGEDDSWLDYQCAITIESDTGTVQVKTIPDDEPAPDAEIFGSKGAGESNKQAWMDAALDAPLGTPTLPIEVVTAKRNDPAPGSESTSGTDAGETTFRRAAPSCVAFLTGSAVRVGFPIGCPNLTDVGGVVPEPASRPDRGEGFSTTTVANVVSTIHVASWKLRYLLPSVPRGPILPPNNPRFESKT